jgi:prophage regulatory protein
MRRPESSFANEQVSVPAGVPRSLFPDQGRRLEEMEMDDKESLNEAESDDGFPRLLRLPAVMRATGLARSTVYRMISERTFPRQVKLSARAVGWYASEVRQWTLGRAAASR